MAWTKTQTVIVVGVAVLAVLAMVGGIKIVQKSRAVGIKAFGLKIHISLAPDETLVTGGWQVEAGQRVFVFITPTWIDPAGRHLQAPQGAQPEVVITAHILEAPEQDMEKLGLKSLFVTQNDTNVSEKYTPAQMKPLMATFKAHGKDRLSTSSMVTLAGRQIQIDIQKLLPGGSSIDLLPTVSSDGISVDLTGAVQIVQATK